MILSSPYGRIWGLGTTGRGLSGCNTPGLAGECCAQCALCAFMELLLAASDANPIDI
jgi:hypothetical protein